MAGDRTQRLASPFAGRAMLSCALTLMTILAGCLPNADRLDPALDVPEAYRAAPGKSPDAALPPLDWWRGFKSKELTALIEEAQVVNLDIAAASARIKQADAQARIAGSALLPVVDANGSGSHSRRSLMTSGGTASTGSGQREGNLYAASLSASYEIDFWGKNRALLEAARNTAVASRYDREVIALSTVASVANTYFLVLSSQDRLRNARENVKSAQRVLDLIRDRLAAGTTSGLEVAQQEALVAQQRALIPTYTQTLQQNIATLAVLIARPPERVAIHGGSTRSLAIPRVTPGLPSDLLVQRPDIREAEANLAAADANIHAARAAFLPSIQLTGQDGYQSAIFRSLFNPQAAFFSFAASIAAPIFDGGNLMGNLEQQKGKQEELVQTYRKTVIQAFADVDSALVAVRQQAEYERLQAQAVEASRRAFGIAETRLREGTVDLVTVLQTQQTLYQAVDSLVQARLARLQAVVGLYQALGGGWPPADAEIEAATAGYVWNGIPVPAPKP
jgi:NodT family efflux transporter outer membrane factor (OMF) lipoprotein